MTRIIAGLAKGRRLDVPSTGTRPTSDKTREAIFSRLDSWGVLEGARVLDLYAGSGALALEAISRGAQRAVLVDSSQKAARVAKKNVVTCGFTRSVKVIARSARSYLASQVGQFDLVFVDPPYSLGEDELSRTLEDLRPHLHAEATVIIERDARSPEPVLPEGLELFGHRRWGDTAAWFIGPAEEEM